MKNKDKTLHMIGNAHIDSVWMWRWQEGFQEVKATFRSALDRLAESEDFIFIASSASHYEWVEKNDPAMFEEIRARVAEGRWQLVGGWWTQADCNVPSGESFVRQALYGQQYFMEKFGKTACVGYNVDSFGHSGALPQILKKSGLDYYVFMRPMPGEKSLPGRVFQWESDDGSRVLCFRILFEYLSWGKEVDVHVARCAEEIREPLDEAMVFYGVGNHGGGPTKENIESIRRLETEDNGLHLIFSHPEAFFKAIEQKGIEFPVVHDDLQHHASGCYSAHSGIKMWNRRAENALVSAEKFSVAASLLTGQPYPDFTQAWYSLLFNQFHDIMAGTSLESAYEDSRNEIGESLAIAARSRNYAQQALSWRVGIQQEEGMYPLVVFNPNAWQCNSCVEVELGSSAVVGATLKDDAGNTIPTQIIQPEASSNGRCRFAFMAQLPALGYRTYRLYPAAPDAEKQSAGAEKPTTVTAENDWYRLALDPETGYIAELYDKANEVQLFSGPAAVPAVMQDNSDTWSHDVLYFHDRIGQFSAKRVYCAEHGPVKTVLRAESEWETSTLVQDFILYHHKKQIDVRVGIDFRGAHKLVKLLFPVKLSFPQATYETSYGVIQREGNGEEEPQQNWVDLSGLTPGKDKGYLSGVAILNNGKYSASVQKDVIGLTVLRSPIYAQHTPYVPTDTLTYHYIDQGYQSFTYSILPHVGTWEENSVVKAAWELNNPPEVVIETYHDGPLPQAMSFASTNVDNVLVSAVKQAEDGSGTVVRAYETIRNQTDAEIILPLLDVKIRACFKPGEIKTFHIPTGGKKAKEILLTELDI